MLALVATHNMDAPVELRTVEEPSAAPDEAIVEVRAFSLNRGELALLATRPQGWRPGQDIAGVVVRRAEDGSGPAEGARVVCLVDGAGWSQRVAVPTHRLGLLPEGVSFVAAAALPIAGLTALRALRVGGSLLGKRVLITGASGGVGCFVVQLARVAGARVTGLVGHPDRVQAVQGLGAEQVVAGVDELEGSFDLILESVGGASLASSIRHIAAGGTIVLFGNSSREQTPLGFGDFFGHARATIYAFFVYESADQQTFGEDLSYLAWLVGQGTLVPQIGLEVSWRTIEQGIAALRDRQFVGKAVFEVD